MGKGKRLRTLRKAKTIFERLDVHAGGTFDYYFTKRYSQDPVFRGYIAALPDPGEYSARDEEEKEELRRLCDETADAWTEKLMNSPYWKD